MLNPIYCTGCGQRLAIPEGYAKGKLRCAECGVFNELSKEVREALAAQAAEAPPRATLAPPIAPPPPPEIEGETYGTLAEESPAPRRDKPPESPRKKKSRSRPEKGSTPAPTEAERELLIRGTEDDDGNPYQVTGDVATRRCPECDNKVERRNAVCNHCGYNFETKAKAERTFQSIDQVWESGLPFQTRLSIFVGLQVLNFVILVASLFSSQGLGVSFILILFSVFLQAFLVGTFERLTLTRTTKGKITLTHMWRYAFLPQSPESVKWKEHEGITVTRQNDFDVIAWVFVFILMGYGCLPGILFWYFVVRPDKFTVALCKDHGSPETPIFRTTNEDRAREVMQMVSETTTLPIQN